NLLNLLRSSAAPAFRRDTGLSDFDWRILSHVAEYQSLTLIELVPVMDRDKSQVGRAVKRLAQLNLLATQKIGGGRHVRLATTAEGRVMYEGIGKLSLHRN